MPQFAKFIFFCVFGFIYSESIANGDFTIEIDNKIHSINEKLILKAGYHDIVFHFPQNNNKSYTYQYYLKNLEIQWKKSSFPQIRYTNLGGGNYVFYGKTLENNKTIAQFSCQFEIKENFWEKSWFWLFVVFFSILFVAFLVYFWFLYDFRQRMKTEQMRQRIAADLHDEVGANLSSITFLVESLKRKMRRNDVNSAILLERISNNSIESATLINDTIWALNPNYDTFDNLLERIRSFASELLSSNDIAFTIENNLTEKTLDLSIEQRRNLYLIIKESINNIAKHAGATKVFLRINEDKNGIKINIEDNGVGFDTNTKFEGNGLKNYNLRSINGEIEVNITSEIGFGTIVSVTLLPKNH